MSEIIQSIISLPTPFNMIVLVVLIGTAGGLIGTFVKQVRKFASHREELDLKREMLDRGMSADEIERVMLAGSESNRRNS